MSLVWNNRLSSTVRPLITCKTNRKVASEKYFDVDYLRSDQSFKASRSALDESQSYLLSHFWTHLVCVWESVWMYMGDGSLRLRNVESWDWFFFLSTIRMQDKNILCIQSLLDCIQSWQLPPRRHPRPHPDTHPYPLHTCPISAAFESMYNHVGGFSEGHSSIALSFALWPELPLKGSRSFSVTFGLVIDCPYYPRHPSALQQLQWIDWSTETQILTLSFIVTKHYRSHLTFSDNLLTSGLKKLPC